MSGIGNADLSVVAGAAATAAAPAPPREEANPTPWVLPQPAPPASALGDVAPPKGLSKLCQRNGCSNWITLAPRWKSKIRDNIQACMDCKKADKKLRDHARTKKAKLAAGASNLVAMREVGLTHLSEGPAHPASEVEPTEDLGEQPPPPLPPPSEGLQLVGHVEAAAMPAPVEAIAGPSQHQQEPFQPLEVSSMEPPEDSVEPAWEPNPSTLDRRNLFDDGHNCWGNLATIGQLHLVDKGSYPRVGPKQIYTHEREEQRYLARCIKLLDLLAPDFLVFGFEASGSAANLRMIQEASGHALAHAGVGSWCYLTGDGASPLWNVKLPIIKSPGGGSTPLHSPRSAKDTTDASGLRIIPLPWSTSALMTRAEEATLRKAEEGSLKHLEKELQGGLKALMIELVNTGFGFELRKAYLQQVDALLKKYGARLCIDEIMTGGRTSDRLLLADELGLRADYITLGKFMTQGIILERHNINPQSIDARLVAGISLGSSILRLMEVLSEVAQFSKGTVDAARERMVNHLQARKQQRGEQAVEIVTWGRGAMVYSNIRCDRNGVLVGRYLPLLGSPPLPIDTSKSMMWYASATKHEKIDPDMLEDRKAIMRSMWKECNPPGGW